MEYDTMVYDETGMPVPPQFPDWLLAVCSLAAIAIPFLLR